MAEKQVLTRAAILAAVDIQTEEVYVPEWGGTVWVRGLTGAERDEFEKGILIERKRGFSVELANFRAKLAAMSMVDAQGQRLFSEADVAALGKKSAAALGRVYDAAARLAGLSAEDVEELTKN